MKPYNKRHTGCIGKGIFKEFLNCKSKDVKIFFFCGKMDPVIENAANRIQRQNQVNRQLLERVANQNQVNAQLMERNQELQQNLNVANNALDNHRNDLNYLRGVIEGIPEIPIEPMRPQRGRSRPREQGQREQVKIKYVL